MIRKLALTAVAIMAAAVTRPEFEVVSVKRNPTFTGRMQGIGSPSPGNFAARNIPLRYLCRFAYNVNSFNVLGGPDWTDSAGWDIVAKTKVVPGQSTRDAIADMSVMLQSVLEERFKLKTHLETRELPVYVLTVAKGGLKMKQAPCDRTEPACQIQLQGLIKTWPTPVWGSFGAMTDFLVRLATATNGQRKIIDNTGLTGIYDYHMEWVYQPPPGPDDPEKRTDAADSPGVSIFSALEQQLGLKLESAKAPVEVLIIDHAEKPESN